jgi:surface carbohydrate biosynthesis protein
MNIYLPIELSVRELDSKLLTATLAASRGHDVLISDLEPIEKGIDKGILPPGIFHTKSLSPTDHKIERHQSTIDNGSVITSIDEEGGLVDENYLADAKFRFSDHTIKQCSAIFSWGTDDASTLKKVYPKYSKKIHKTGSPRADLWRPIFSKYWGKPHGTPNKPYLLVVSNMSHANYFEPFHNLIEINRKGRQYERDPKLFFKKFAMASEHYLTTGAFIEAIQHLAKNNNGYDIVLRPHPTEDVKSWKIFLKGIPNVHVIREGSITAWVNNAFAIMHNGCTTALEATVAGKPLVTYVPYKQRYGNKLPNKLGYYIQSVKELSAKVNKLFENKSFNSKKFWNTSFPAQVSKKIFIEKNQFAAEKMIIIWESLKNDEHHLSQPLNLFKLKLFLKKMKFNGALGNVLRKLSPIKLSGLGSDSNGVIKNLKFPKLEKNDIFYRFEKLKKILKVNVELECKFLSEKTILIKRNKK